MDLDHLENKYPNNRIILQININEILYTNLNTNIKEFKVIAYIPDKLHQLYNILLENKHFQFIPEGYTIPIYDLETAKIKFPYLFFDTNPLLYRKFYLWEIDEKERKNLFRQSIYEYLKPLFNNIETFYGKY